MTTSGDVDITLKRRGLCRVSLVNSSVYYLEFSSKLRRINSGIDFIFVAD